jgi:hypothetical protein
MVARVARAIFDHAHFCTSETVPQEAGKSFLMKNK